MQRSGFEDLIAAGVVLTGGGSKMEGLIELAEEIFTHQYDEVPRTVTGLSDVVRNPIHATGVGLLMFGQQHARERGTETRSEFSVSGLYERMKNWFQGNF